MFFVHIISSYLQVNKRKNALHETALICITGRSLIRNNTMANFSIKAPPPPEHSLGIKMEKYPKKSE